MFFVRVADKGLRLDAASRASRFGELNCRDTELGNGGGFDDRGGTSGMGEIGDDHKEL